MIFRRYLGVSGINELVRDLRAKNICTKARTYSTGKTRWGIPFGRVALSYFLRNRFFIGDVKYKGEVLPGEQPPIMDIPDQKEVRSPGGLCSWRCWPSHYRNARHQGRYPLSILCLSALPASMDQIPSSFTNSCTSSAANSGCSNCTICPHPRIAAYLNRPSCAKERLIAAVGGAF
jgi:hypothetical protein